MGNFNIIIMEARRLQTRDFMLKWDSVNIIPHRSVNMLLALS